MLLEAFTRPKWHLRTRGLARIWHLPPKQAVRGSNPRASVFIFIMKTGALRPIRDWSQSQRAMLYAPPRASVILLQLFLNSLVPGLIIVELSIVVLLKISIMKRTNQRDPSSSQRYCHSSDTDIWSSKCCISPYSRRFHIFVKGIHQVFSSGISVVDRLYI